MPEIRLFVVRFLVLPVGGFGGRGLGVVFFGFLGGYGHCGVCYMSCCGKGLKGRSYACVGTCGGVVDFVLALIVVLSLDIGIFTTRPLASSPGVVR